MLSATQELEQQKTKDTEEQPGTQPPAHEEANPEEEKQEQVQQGSLSEDDRKKLVAQPEGQAPGPPSGQSKVVALVKQWESRTASQTGPSTANKPAPPASQQAPPPAPTQTSPAPSKTSPATTTTSGSTTQSSSSQATQPSTSQQAQSTSGQQTQSSPSPVTAPTTSPVTAPSGSKATPSKTSPATTTTSGSTTQSSSSQATQPSTSQRAQSTSGQQAQSSDPYALLKKDVSSLSHAEKQERPNLLKKKYVDDWKEKKSKKMKDLTEGLSDDEKSKEETRQSFSDPKKSFGKKFVEKVFGGLDKGVEWGDKAFDYGGAAISTLADAASTGYEEAGVNDYGIPGLIGNATTTAAGAWGALSGTYGMVRGGMQAKEKYQKGDKIGTVLSAFDIGSKLFGAASGGIGALGGAAGLLGGGLSGLKYLGVKDIPAHDTASSVLGHGSSVLGYISNALGTAGSLMDTGKGVFQTASYGSLALRKKTRESKAKMADEYKRAKGKYKEMKEAYDRNDPGARDKEKRIEMLKQRHAYKRSKDFQEAMASAQKQAGIKSVLGGGWGIASGALNTLSGSIGLLGSFTKDHSGLLGKGVGKLFALSGKPELAGEAERWTRIGGKAVGIGLGALSGAMKFATKEYGDRIAQSIEGFARNKVNKNSGKKYLDEKVAAFLKEPEPQADHVNEEEARKIIAQRLGVEDPTKYGEIYKKLAERRADRILNREEGWQDVLAAMGLSEKADKATILEAMGVS